MRGYDRRCSMDGCDRLHYAHDLCRGHLARKQKYGDTGAGPLAKRKAQFRKCSVEVCDKQHYAKGLCRCHWQRFVRHGDAGTDPAKSENKRVTDKSGYIFVTVPENTPGAYFNGRGHWKMQEHRLVMQNTLGRPILPTEEVHHKNGIRSDNRPENLELWVRSKQPWGARASDLIHWANEILETYALVEPKEAPCIIRGW